MNACRYEAELDVDRQRQHIDAMGKISSESFVEAVASLLEEIHVGPPNPKATWITSNRPDSGFLGTLDTVSARLASEPPEPGLNSIAAHSAHLLYSLSLALRAMHGENPYATAKWEESWRTKTVDDAAWTSLRAELRRVHGELVAAIRRGPPLDDPDLFKGVIALVGHGAYHLGAMRTIHRLLVERGQPRGSHS
jgi:DinB superfamily